MISIPGVRIAGVSASVPIRQEDNMDFPGMTAAERSLLIQTTGIRYRRKVSIGTTAADLCLRAADDLLTAKAWEASSVQYLVFVSQTPDYFCIPATACMLQHKLGLSRDCVAFDVALGCSGYVYGLHILSAMMQSRPGSRGLLLVGDVSTQTIHPDDKATAPLFSDAGSATLLEYDEESRFYFNMGTDGKDFDAIIMREGGYRSPFSDMAATSSDSHALGRYMQMDGMRIFNFSIRYVPESFTRLMTDMSLSAEQLDYVLFHQANRLMLEHIRKKLKLSSEQVPYSLSRYGNTGSASIPLTMVTELTAQLADNPKKLLLSGFGVGLSWATMYWESSPFLILPLIEIES